jgi:hypothetical protein
MTTPSRSHRRRRAPAASSRLARIVDRLPASGPAQAAVMAGVLLFAAVVVGLAGHAADPVRAGTDEVSSADLVCPGVVDRLPGARSTLTVAALPPDSAATGAMTVTDLAAGAPVRGSSSKPGVSVIDTSKDGAPAVLIRGRDGLAPGLSGESVIEPTTGAGNALSATTCAQPGISQWFIGASTALGRRDRLVLANPAPVPASVDLSFWADTGPLSEPNSADIAVPANGATTLPLDVMAPGHERLAIQVTASRGAVAASLNDLGAVGATVNGDDWLAPVVGPDRSLVLPGLPDRTTARTLYLATPGDRDAIVKVRLLTADNDVAPAGADTVTVQAGRVGEYDLSAAAAGQAAAVVVTSDQPVLASVRSTRAEGGGTDFAWAGAVPALSGPAVLPDARSNAAGATSLLLAAPRGGTIHVALRLPNGTTRSTDVRIPADRAVALPEATGGTGRFSVIVTPAAGSGPVYAASVLRLGPSGITVVPLLPERVSVVVPAVVPDVTVVTAGNQSRP